MTVLTTIESEQAEPVERFVGPGARLRQERQAQGLDQARAAAQLHLSDAMIEALETDAYDALPGAVFAQGYLRNYARLLGVSENEVLSAYHRIRPQSELEVLQGKRSAAVMQEVRSSHRMVQLATWMIVLVLLVLLGIWWQDRPRLETESVDEVTAEPQFTPIETEPLTQEPVGAYEDPLAAPEPANEAEFETPLPQTPPAVTADLAPTSSASMERRQRTSDAAPPPSQADARSGDEPVVATAPPPVERGEAGSDSGADAITPEASAPEVERASVSSAVEQARPAPLASGRLVFEFTGRCWAEVRDATGKAQIIGEMGDGDRRTVATDLGPFKIVLGNVKAVRMSVDGEPFDLSAHTRGVVARFELDPQRL